jgi:hypothetical protein
LRPQTECGGSEPIKAIAAPHMGAATVGASAVLLEPYELIGALQ